MYYYTVLRPIIRYRVWEVCRYRVLNSLSELQASVKRDIGYVPDWLQTVSENEYLQVEEECQLSKVGRLILDIEGCENDEVTPGFSEVGEAQDQLNEQY